MTYRQTIIASRFRDRRCPLSGPPPLFIFYHSFLSLSRLFLFTYFNPLVLFGPLLGTANNNLRDDSRKKKLHGKQFLPSRDTNPRRSSQYLFVDFPLRAMSLWRVFLYLSAPSSSTTKERGEKERKEGKKGITRHLAVTSQGRKTFIIIGNKPSKRKKEEVKKRLPNEKNKDSLRTNVFPLYSCSYFFLTSRWLASNWFPTKQ